MNLAELLPTLQTDAAAKRAAAVMLWWLFFNFGATQHLSTSHPDPFNTYADCAHYAMQAQRGEGGAWHCESEPPASPPSPEEPKRARSAPPTPPCPPPVPPPVPPPPPP